LIFRLQAQKFSFRAVESVFFPPGKAGNVFRGVLASRIPVAPVAGLPGGFADPPRPFILRASHLDGLLIEPGGEFALDTHVFDLSGATMKALTDAFRDLGDTGLGPRRAQVELLVQDAPRTIELDLGAVCPASGITVRFVTPTELKGLPPSPSAVPFEVLFARTRDRISSLVTMYGEAPLGVDFAAMAARAVAVRMASCELVHRRITRRSSRTGQTHGIGGFTGAARYEGDVAEFLPWFRAAWWTGIGRHTVWGNGAITCD
jgi:hypothetical protein